MIKENITKKPIDNFKAAICLQPFTNRMIGTANSHT